MASRSESTAAPPPEVEQDLSRAQPRPLSLTKKLIFAALPALFLLAAAEAGLRLTGAAARCPTHKNSIPTARARYRDPVRTPGP